MEAYSLSVDKREVTGRQVAALRREGLIPGTVYGAGTEPRNVSVAYGVFEKLYKKLSESSLVDLAVNGDEPVKVLVGEVQQDPIAGKFLHIDFRQVNMKEEIETDIELRFEGEAPAVKEKGGFLVTNLDTLTVRCLPGDLVDAIAVDLSSLKEFDDTITVADITPPAGITFVNEPEEAIGGVEEPMSEEEIKALDEAVVEDVSAVKTEGEEKAEEKAEEAKQEEGAAS